MGGGGGVSFPREKYIMKVYSSMLSVLRGGGWGWKKVLQHT